MKGDTVLRRLLALEAVPEAAFVEGMRNLCGADALVLLTPTREGTLQVRNVSGLPAGMTADTLQGVTPDPSSHPLLFPLRGGFHLETADVSSMPLAWCFPEASWCLAGVGEARAYGALWFGTKTPPAVLLSDPLLAAQMLRVLGAQLGVGHPGEPAGAQAAAAALERLSHELKTPLVSIKGYAELILDQANGALEPRIRQWVARIAGGANRLAALFRKATAEARAGDADAYEARPVDPVEWVRRGVAEAQTLSRGRQLEWSWHAEPDLCWVQVDPEAAQDLLMELLQNAARSTPDGGRIAVELVAADRAEAPGVHVRVRDSGIGFPVGAAGEQLFTRFATLTPLFAHHSGEFEFGAAGLGLGLTMARGVARAHGGELWAEGRGRDESTLPGAIFHVWLPRATSGVEKEAGGPGLGRLLLLEPDAEALQILAEALGEHYQVVGVATAAAARRAWNEGEWAACIIEPRVTDGGVALVQALRARPGAGKTAILTYSTVSAEATAWRAAGADSCVGKPARTRVLLQRLHTVRSRRAER